MIMVIQNLSFIEGELFIIRVDFLFFFTRNETLHHVKFSILYFALLKPKAFVLNQWRGVRCSVLMQNQAARPPRNEIILIWQWYISTILAIIASLFRRAEIKQRIKCIAMFNIRGGFLFCFWSCFVLKKGISCVDPLRSQTTIRKNSPRKLFLICGHFKKASTLPPTVQPV